MNFKKISQIRLSSQQVSNSKFQTTKELLSWMGAIQAQDFKMAKLAVAARLKNPKSTEIESAIDKGEIIRTHVLRPTWHFVAAEDIYWMLELTAPRLMANLKSRHRELGVEEALLKKTNKLIVKSLSKGVHLSRNEIYQIFEKAKIDYSKNRGAHFLMWAEFNSLICSGASKNGKPTYALLEERVKRKNKIPESEAISKLAKKYFFSHGPATVADFSWWSGLTMKRAKEGLNAVISDLESYTIDEDTFWWFESNVDFTPKVHLLPAYDEFLIAYKNKSHSLPFSEHRRKVHYIGTFWPFIVIDGLISGTWKLTKKKSTTFTFEAFRKFNKKEQAALKQEVQNLSQYLELDISF